MLSTPAQGILALQSQKVMAAAMSADALQEAKIQLLQAWLDDWVGHTGKTVPETPAVLSAPLEQTLKPLSPNRVRAKDTSLTVAIKQQQQQQQQQESVIAWCDLNVPS